MSGRLSQPLLADEAFLEDVARRRGQGDGFHVWWLGQSGFLVHWKEHFALLDPYLSDSLTRKYAATDKPHVRMTARVVAPERLSFVEVVSSSHNHTDHLDAETLAPILAANPDLQLVIAEANRVFVCERLGIPLERPVGLNDGLSAQVGPFTFHAVAAAHEEVERDEGGRCRCLGCVLEFGPWKIYHSGDTVLYDGIVERLLPFQVDLALLPINGRSPERRVAGNLGGREAARLACEIGARMVIPCHYEMFEFNTASPAEFIAEAQALGQPFHVLRNGEGWSSSSLVERSPARN